MLNHEKPIIVSLNDDDGFSIFFGECGAHGNVPSTYRPMHAVKSLHNARRQEDLSPSPSISHSLGAQKHSFLFCMCLWPLWRLAGGEGGIRLGVMYNELAATEMLKSVPLTESSAM